MKNTLSSIFLFFFFASVAIAGKRDSLEHVLANTKDIKDRAKLLNLLASEIRNIDPASSLQYGKEALKLEMMQGDCTGVATTCNVLGTAHYRLGDYSSSLNMLGRSLSLRAAAADSEGVAYCCTNFGNVYFDKGDYSSALRYHLRSLRIAENKGNKLMIAQALGNIGLVYFQLQEYEKALDHQQRSLALRSQLDDRTGVARTLSNISIIYLKQDKLDDALEWQKRALEMYRDISDKAALSTTLMNLGAIYLDQGKYSNALKSFFEAEEIQEQIGSKADLPSIYTNIGITYRLQDDSAQALKYHRLALKTAGEMRSNESLMSVWKEQYITYDRFGNHKKALESYLQYSAYKDSLFNSEKSNLIAEMQTRYEVEKKENAIQLLSKENDIQKLQISNTRSWLAAAAILLLLLGTGAFLFIKQLQLKSRQQAVELQQKLLRSQMNPHFIFNSLAAIQGFVVAREPKEAARFLASFSKLVRLILENSREEFILFEKEIETLQYYLQLQQLRFPGLFEYSIETGNGIHSELALIPPMLMQPFIENAIEHGLPGVNKGEGRIHISFSRDNDMLICRVTDNGKGIDHTAGSHKAGYRSFALSITRERLELLNRKSRKKITMKVEDIHGANESGTHVIFSIPYKELSQLSKK